MPAGVVALAAVLSVGQAVVAQVRCVDAARAGARAAARGEPPALVRELAADGMSGATVTVRQSGAFVTVQVSRRVSLVLPSGPSVRVEGSAVAQIEQRSTSADRGSASVLAVGVVLIGLVLSTGSAAVGAAVVARHRAEAAADLGALAAADVLLARASGTPCGAAAAVVSAQGAVLVGCAVDRGDAVVRTTVRPGGRVGALGTAVAVARAGPAAISEGAGPPPVGR